MEKYFVYHGLAEMVGMRDNVWIYIQPENVLIIVSEADGKYSVVMKEFGTLTLSNLMVVDAVERL